MTTHQLAIIAQEFRAFAATLEKFSREMEALSAHRRAPLTPYRRADIAPRLQRAQKRSG